ncbi:MAG TPA: cysteine dioxygenase family protein [Thermoanaerobaculia bacterium]|jgi:predicted metal-dependent enzyme (double-stranded beta helix superfamily)|nr:cysteine dioxygenase family protein [Thermoanaerobaculia bacterium]
MQAETVVAPLIEELREAVRLGEVSAITGRIKHTLESFIPAEGLIFPERFHKVKPEGYSRRLLYRDAELGFTALVMTWGPGQKTALHDHSGIWCVEGVLEGEMAVQRFEMLEEPAPGVFHFQSREVLGASAGSAGALIPPLEHHVLANPNPDRIALTLHVYGGEMDHCTIFEPVDEQAGLYRSQVKSLCYDE